MSKKKKSKKKIKSLKKHKKVGRQLLPPLLQQSKNTIKEIKWFPTFLPEFLWIDSIYNYYDRSEALKYYNDVLDILDNFNPNDNEPLLGIISCFGLIPIQKRKEALIKLQNILKPAILEPFGIVISMYPNCPMSWLVSEEWRQSNRIDPDKALIKIKHSIKRILDGKSEYATQCRMLPLSRLFKHNKLFLSKDLDPELLDGIPLYPYGTESQRNKVEYFGRLTMNMILPNKKEIGEWSKHFWRHNWSISICEFPTEKKSTLNFSIIIKKIITVSKEMIEKLLIRLNQEIYQVSLDLYNTDRDEILFGLLSRQFRFMSAIVKNHELWSIDLGRILLRCMADTHITFKWLIKQNDEKLFEKFKKSSLGKEKLLKMHIENLLEDFSDERMQLEEIIDDLKESINQEIWEELLPIELGSWSGKDTRKIANEVGLEDLYRFLYAPACAEIHGEWVSIRDLNLKRCLNPLHRFHLLPSFGTAFFTPAIIFHATDLFTMTYVEWNKAYGRPSKLDIIEEYSDSLNDILSSIISKEKSNN